MVKETCLKVVFPAAAEAKHKYTYILRISGCSIVSPLMVAEMLFQSFLHQEETSEDSCAFWQQNVNKIKMNDKIISNNSHQGSQFSKTHHQFLDSYLQSAAGFSSLVNMKLNLQ